MFNIPLFPSVHLWVQGYLTIYRDIIKYDKIFKNGNTLILDKTNKRKGAQEMHIDAENYSFPHLGSLWIENTKCYKMYAKNL